MPRLPKIAGKALDCCKSPTKNVSGLLALLIVQREDLTRHLQIMLRTHGELSYKQEAALPS